MSESRRTTDIDLTIEIDADVETVWRAISDGEEISRWFPLNAEVEPGVGGTTIVRMVNAGFSAEEDWADYLATIDSGWRYFLWNLKVYVQRHAGTPRRMVVAVRSGRGSGGGTRAFVEGDSRRPVRGAGMTWAGSS